MQASCAGKTAAVRCRLYQVLAIIRIAFADIFVHQEIGMAANCPECDSEIDVDELDVEVGDEMSCSECGALIRVASDSPLELELADDDDDEEEDDDDEEEEDDDEEESEDEEEEGWTDETEE
jgi:alpha-aminoadipate carrier protein LysW